MPSSVNPVLRAATRELIDAAKGVDPLQRLKSAVGDLTHRFHSPGTLLHEEQDDEVLLHSSANLTIYHITLSPGLQYPAHNHLMDAVIGIYEGCETNFVYRVVGGEIGNPSRQEYNAPALLHLPPHTVHAVANTGSGRSGALHVYLGDLLHTHRQMWDLRSNRSEPFENGRYLEGARPLRPPTLRMDDR